MKNQSGILMWPFSEMSLSTATLIGTLANWGLLISLLGGVISTFVIVKTADVKEEHWAEERQRSNERIVELNNETARLHNETARLQEDNLALQTVLLPRHVGLIGIDQEPPAKKWFAGFEQWTGIKILIQVVSGDPEAQNLANEIAIVLSKFGWHPEMIDEKRSGISLHLHEGVAVFSPASYKAWNPSDELQQTYARLGNAAVALARALTNAGLGVGDKPVSGSHGLSIVVDLPPDSDAGRNQYGKFSPPLDGVYLQVGSRPIGLTMQWIRGGRRKPDGSPPDPPKATDKAHK